jgi:hypothetical protein
VATTPGRGPEHAALGAGRQGVGRGRLGEEAAQAGVGLAEVGLEGRELAVEALDGGAHQRPAEALAGVLDQRPGREAVAAVGDQVVAGDDPSAFASSRRTGWPSTRISG